MPPILSAPRALSIPSYPPASELLVITANQPTRWGQFQPGEVEYETRIARPGVPTVERRPGIFVSDGSQLWELRITARPFEVDLCECVDERSRTRGSFRTEVIDVALRRADSDDWQPLFDVDRGCVEAGEHFCEQSYLVGIAGSRLLFVGLSGYDICDEEPHQELKFRIHDLAGQTVVSDLEKEFAAATIDDARNRASEQAVEREREGPGYWPHHLWLDAVIPNYDAPQFTAEIVFELRRDPDAVLNPSVELPPSSSLFPPPDMAALIEQAGAEAVVVGWSRVGSGGARGDSAPASPP